MKKMMVMITICMLAFAGMAMAQTYTSSTGSPIYGIDKLGAHQNGGRGCVGCHAPHSGGRGNGGTLQWNGTSYTSIAGTGDQGDEALWGQDLGPIYGHALNFPGGTLTITDTSSERLKTGVAMCLSCHDGNVAKGAMMTNQSFEQAAGLLPATYGTQPIPTLLGADGGSNDNYGNDHPVGPAAKLGLLSGIKASTNLFALDTTTGKIIKGSSYAGSKMETFYTNYGLPTIIDARAGAGWATDMSTNLDDAYVVCTTCHTPHSMYTASNKGGTYPSFFFVAAPYNPSANTAGGTKASSATQFCRQCHFTGAGGSNEGSNILTIGTAF